MSDFYQTLVQQNIVYYDDITMGCVGARDPMIALNVPLVHTQVDSFLGTFPEFRHLRDDLRSAGVIAMIEAIDSMASKGKVKDANPTGYIKVAVRNAITVLLDEEISLAPSRTQMRYRKTKRPLDSPSCIPDDSQLESFYTEDELAVVDLRDEILGCCQDDLEKQIVLLREKGYVDEEIANTMNCTLTRVWELRKKIHERLLTRRDKE